MKEKEFFENKKSALLKLEKAKNANLVDKGIIPILDLINNSKDFFSSSSCYGRIVLLEIPAIGDKKAAKFLGKWHHTIKINDLISALEHAKFGQIWLLSQSPIIHISAKTIEAADFILKTAVSCGFKNSGLKSIGKRINIEICSTERLDTPIGEDGVLFCNHDHLNLLVKISNDIMNKSIKKLKKFELKIKESFK